MADKRAKDRLSPPLMHVFRAAYEARDAKQRIDLRDEAGDRVVAGRRLSVRTAVSEPVLRKEVSRDLGALLNTINLEAVEDLTKTPEVRRSILNYGIPDLVHRSLEEWGVNDVAGELQRALISFEPRLVPQSIRISRQSVDAAELTVRFLVRADLKCDPLNVAVEFVADLEADTGAIKVDRL